MHLGFADSGPHHAGRQANQAARGGEAQEQFGIDDRETFAGRLLEADVDLRMQILLGGEPVI